MIKKLSILIVDDDRMMVKTIEDILRAEGHEAETAHSAPEALEKIAETRFACVLSDIKMPEVNGIELYRAIKARQPELPVVLMTAYSSDKLVKEGLEEGAIVSLSKPLDINLLLSFFSSLHKERTIVIVDDNPQFCKTLGDILIKHEFSVIQIIDPYRAVEGIKGNEEVVLLDMKFNGISCLDILKEIREKSPHLPVILITGYREEMSQVIQAAFNLNACICLYKPIQIDKLLQFVTEIHHQALGRFFSRSGKEEG